MTGRLINLGITLILVTALVYFAGEAIPPVWFERFGEVTGLDKIIPRVFEPASVPVAANDFAEPGIGSASGVSDDLKASEIGPTDVTSDDLLASGAGPVDLPVTGDDVDTDAMLLDGMSPEDTPGRVEPAPSNSTSGSAAVPSTPGRTFFVDFSPDSALLESDAWHELDSVALLLRQHPDRVALITDADAASGAADSDPELSRSRITAVEQYLQAAGISRQRLRAGERAQPDTPRGQDDPEAGSQGMDDRFVFISIGSTLPP